MVSTLSPAADNTSSNKVTIITDKSSTIFPSKSDPTDYSGGVQSTTSGSNTDSIDTTTSNTQHIVVIKDGGTITSQTIEDTNNIPTVRSTDDLIRPDYGGAKTINTNNNHHIVPPKRIPERVSSETSEIVALVIGIVAGALIAVILVILVILKFKSRGDRSFKIDDGGKGGGYNQEAALLGGGTSSTNGQTQYQINGGGALRNGGGDKNPMMQKSSKKRDSKDIKEWYV